MPKRINISKGQCVRLRGRAYEFFNAVPTNDTAADAPHDLQFRDEESTLAAGL